MVVVKHWLSRLGFAQASKCAPVMVVGMHRSGTSFLTGSLQQAGLELGKHSAWNPHNLKGNRENQDVVDFHDAVLAARDCAWDRPPTDTIRWSAAESHAARLLVRSYDTSRPWGFKDPRGLLMAECWRLLLPNLRFVGIFRHPLAVARSLHTRSGMPMAQGLELWQAYNNQLLALHRRAPFPLLCFDEDERVLSRKLDQVLPELGLQPLANDRFFTAELKHHHPETEVLPPELAHMYQTLWSIAR